MTCTCTPMSTCAECAEKMICYDTVDRFLRNNLGDDDYAEYSAALDAAIETHHRRVARQR